MPLCAMESKLYNEIHKVFQVVLGSKDRLQLRAYGLLLGSLLKIIYTPLVIFHIYYIVVNYLKYAELIQGKKTLLYDLYRLQTTVHDHKDRKVVGLVRVVVFHSESTPILIFISS